MNRVLLASKRQAIDYGSVGMMENSTYTWDLVWVLESISIASCKTPVTSTDSIHSKIQPGRSAESKTNRIMLAWPTDTELEC